MQNREGQTECKDGTERQSEKRTERTDDGRENVRSKAGGWGENTNRNGQAVRKKRSTKE